MARNELLDAALAYAARGWAVLPCRPREKTPLTAHGLKDATTDPDVIRAWWAKQPAANVAIACGPSGLVVIDCDVKAGARGIENWLGVCAELGISDATVTAETPSKGLHLLYSANGHTVRNSAGRLASGIDVRAEGGYVVVAPSWTPEGEYRWAQGPDDVELLPLPAPLAERLAAPSSTATRPQPAAGAIPEGRRNETLTSRAGAMRRKGLGQAAIEAALLVENAARCQPPLDEAEVGRIAASVARYDPATEGDLGHAENLAGLWRDQVRWAAHRNTWMLYDGTRWAPASDNQIAFRAATDLRGVYAAQLAATGDTEDAKRLNHLVRETCFYARILGPLSFLKGFEGFHTDAAQWDADPWLLNVANGTIDLRTGQLRPHNPQDLLTKLAPVAFEAEAEGPSWEAHLTYFLPSPAVRRQVQRDLGMALVGADLEEMLPIWHGVGANGKSTTAGVIQAVLGDYAQRAAPDLLVQRRHEQHPTELADLAGARVVFSVEIASGARLNEQRVKDLTGGDPVKARYMYSNFFEFAPTWTLFLLCNHKPTVQGQDLGIWRRLRLVPWAVSMPRAHQLPQEQVVATLTAEGPAILRWLLEGLADWQREPHWLAAEVQAATEDYRSEQDRLGGFLADCCDLGPRYTVAVGQLYDAYATWCAETGEEPLGKRAFGAALRDRGMAQRRDSTGATRRWVGLRLLTLSDTTSGKSLSESDLVKVSETLSDNVRNADDLEPWQRAYLAEAEKE